MKVGDIRMEVPLVDCSIMLADKQPRKCKVIYIHPKWRFYRVEFTTELGWTFRETYYFRDRDPAGPPLPDEIRAQREVDATPDGGRFSLLFRRGRLYRA